MLPFFQIKPLEASIIVHEASIHSPKFSLKGDETT